MRRVARALAALSIALAGCPAPRPALRPPRPLPLPLPASPPGHDEPALTGVVHVVRPGETVWRIARAYGMDPADLMETNGIDDPRSVPAGAELFVPGAREVVEVPPAPAPIPDPPPAALVTPTPASTTGSAATSTPPAPAPSPPARPDEAAPPTAGTRGGAPLAWPLRGVLYGRFGVREGRRHDGIDIAAPEGTPVGAAADGTVIFAGEQVGYGAIVILRHERGLVTVYTHNSSVLVREGERVKRGQPVARVGQTGKTSGPHLHFEVREGTRPKNPLLYLP